MSGPEQYPWYVIVFEGDDVKQGDILQSCPVFLPPDNFAEKDTKDWNFRWEERDVVVMSHSCDLDKERPKLTDVLLCAVWKRSEMPHNISSPDGMENIRKGRFPGFHLLAECTLPGSEREVSAVDFRRLYSVPLTFFRKRAAAKRRIRLLPPYREYLSQAFARYFMRVGLPLDIPSFKTNSI